MLSNKVLARTAGILYMVVAIGGAFSELIARGSVTVPGDAAATAANIVSHAALFKAGFIADLVDFAAFLGVGLILFAILRSVSLPVAVAMLAINAVSVAIQALNMLNHVGALLVATDPRFTAGLSASHSLVMLLLEMHRQGYLIAQIFFGSYLLPLAYLVYRSGLFPRALGAIVALAGAGYLADVVAVYAAPDFQSGVALYFGAIGGIAELLFVLWLLVMGARKGELA